MLYGKFQVGIGAIILVLLTASGAAFIVRELLGLGSWPGFAAWLLVLVIGGRTSYLSWRRDWGNEPDGGGASGRAAGAGPSSGGHHAKP